MLPFVLFDPVKVDLAVGFANAQTLLAFLDGSRTKEAIQLFFGLVANGSEAVDSG